MLKEGRTTKTTVVILVIIAAVLSIFAYQYSTFTSKKIVDIASQDVKSVFGDKFQSALSSLLHLESKNLLNDLIKKSLQGNTGSADIAINDNIYTIAYQPVVIGGKSFMTLYIRAQHTLTSDVSALIDQQKYITILEVTVIGVVAFIAAFMLFSWNKRLETTVNVRTAELKRANDSLASANEQLKIHDKMQKEFINIAAHELRTPTQSIVAYSEL